MEWLLGIVQGFTEFIPVSSSAHLILFSWFLSGEPLPMYFNVALHFGTTLAVLIFFWKDWWQMVFVSQERRLLWLLAFGSIPAGLLGLSFKDAIETYLHHPLILVFPLASMGFLLWFLDKQHPQNRTLADLGYRDAFWIGLAQACALVPGVSRSGATITCCRYLNMHKKDSTRFSFLLGTPAMLGASFLHGKDFLAHSHDTHFWMAMGLAFLSGLLAIRFMLSFVQRFGFFGFALYRLGLALLVLLV